MVTVPWSIGKDSLRLRAGPPRARRSLYACGLLVLGFALARFAAPGVSSAWWLAIAPAALVIAILSSGLACRLALAAAVVLLGAGWYHARILERPPAPITWQFDDELRDGHPILTTVRGVVIESPRAIDPPSGLFAPFARNEPAVGFTLSLSAFEPDDSKPSILASGEVRVRLGGERAAIPPALRAGSVVRLTGRLSAIRPPANPGEPNALEQAAQDNLVGTLTVPDPAQIEFCLPEWLGEHASSWWHGAIGRLHARCEAAIEGGPAADARTRQSRALLGALLLGQRDGPLDEVNAAFTRLGVLHLVAISGFNLAVMAGAAMFGLRLTGDRGWLEPVGVAVLIGLYMLVLPAQAPILRAGILVLVLLATDALGRRYDRATILGWIALILLIIRPLDAWSLGFQLSFGIVAALLLLGDTVHYRLWGVPLRGLAPTHQPHGRPAWWAWIPPTHRWFVGAFKAQISAGLLAWAVSIPVIACHTGQVGLLAPIMTLIVLPLTVIVLWGGYLALLIGVVAPSAAALTGGVLDRLATLLVEVVMTLDHIPGASMSLPRITPWWALAGVAGVVYLVMRGSRKDRWSWAIVCVLAAWLGVEVFVGPRLAARAPLRIDTLAVSDGSCYLIRSGGEAMLWDCGSLNTTLGERTLPRAIRALGAWSVPTVVVTHAHIDHFSALPDMVEPLGIERVIVPPQLARAAAADPAGPAGILLAALARRGVRVETLARGDHLRIAGHDAEVRWPPAEQEFRNPNDSSLVVMIGVNAGGAVRRVLVTGDASREALAHLLPAAADVPEAARWRADVLELPHHGAYIDPAVELVHLVNPSIVLQSTGPRRAADTRWFPHMDGRAWYRTPYSGAAWVEIAPEGSIRSGSMR